MANENREYTRLPLLALRGLHVFPGMLLTFEVERPASVAAVNLAVKNDQLIFLAAQKDPEQYRDLIVRVRGFSARFIDLSKQMQDHVISRVSGM